MPNTQLPRTTMPSPERKRPNGLGHIAGRGTSLTPERHKKFIELIAKGNYITTVCQALGINRSTYYNWRREGKPQDVIDPDTGEVLGQEYPDNIYGDFIQDLDAAHADAEIVAVEALTGHFHDDWRAAAEFLSRKFPERWNPKVAVELTGKDGGPVELSEKKESLFARLDVLHIEREGQEPEAISPGAKDQEPVDAEIIEDDSEEEQQMRLPI